LSPFLIIFISYFLLVNKISAAIVLIRENPYAAPHFPDIRNLPANEIIDDMLLKQIRKIPSELFEEKTR
jgi:hypothetical protein